MLALRFPDAPITWDLQIAALAEPARVEWSCLAGPPGWPGTRISWALEQTGAGVAVRLDHTGFPVVDDMFRTVTVGWAQMLLSLQAFLESGERRPFFTH